VFREVSADDLDGAQPTAERHERGEFPILLTVHRGGKFVLHRFQFIVHGVPLPAVRKVGNAVAPIDHILFETKSLGQNPDLAGNIFYRLPFLGLDRQIAIRNQRPEIEGKLDRLL